jgi:hypothetical protein
VLGQPGPIPAAISQTGVTLGLIVGRLLQRTRMRPQKSRTWARFVASCVRDHYSRPAAGRRYGEVASRSSDHGPCAHRGRASRRACGLVRSDGHRSASRSPSAYYGVWRFCPIPRTCLSTTVSIACVSLAQAELIHEDYAFVNYRALLATGFSNDLQCQRRQREVRSWPQIGSLYQSRSFASAPALPGF